MNRIYTLFLAMLVFTASSAWAVQDQKAEDVILSIANAGVVKTLNGTSASFSPQEDLLIVTEKGNTIIYEPVIWRELKKINGTSHCFSPDQDMLVVEGSGSLTFFNLPAKKVSKSYGGGFISFDAGCRMAAIANYSAVTNDDARVTIFNTSNGEIIRQIHGWLGKFSSSGRLMAVNRYASSLFSSANQVLLYETLSWQLLDSFDGFLEGFYGESLVTYYGQNKRYHNISAWEENSPSGSNKQSRLLKNNSNWQLDIDAENNIVTIRDARMLAVKNVFKKGEFESTMEYEERMSKWEQDYISPIVLGKYDADKRGFNTMLAGRSVFVSVPREKAVEMQGHQTKIYVAGKLKYYDAENARLINAALVDDVTNDRFALTGIGASPERARIPVPIPLQVATGGDINMVPDFKIAPRPNDIAIVIGIEKYQTILPSDYSRSDARLVKEYLKALGLQERNIVLILNERATKSGIETAIEGWLPNRVKNDSKIIFYYSGHGAPEPATGEAYIVPFDGDPNYLTTSGYSLKRLYEKLGNLKAYETVVLLDSCFSGSGGRSVLAKGARPLVMMKDAAVVSRNIAVLTATQGAQISASSPEKGHGIFTYYFLQSLKDGKRTIAEIYEYIKPFVEDEARALNVEQSPSLNPKQEKLAGRFILRYP